MRILVCLIFLTACAPEKKHHAQAPSQLISEIPQGCSAYMTNGQLTIGAHEFGTGNIKIATAFDCGAREGKRCFYFLHVTSAGVPIDDVRCE